MSDFQFDEYQTPKQKRSVVFFMIIVLVAIGHYLIYDYVQEQNKLKEAAIEAEANRQIYRINGVEVSKEEYDQALQLQVTQQESQPAQQNQQPVQQNNEIAQQDQYHESELPTGQVRKCFDAQNKVVYQTETCSSKGLRMAKVLTSADGAITEATYSYKQEQARQESQKTYEVDGRQVSKEEFDAVVARNRQVEEQNEANLKARCANLETYRENIRSRQRHDSTQYLRDEYNRVSKEWQEKCLGISRQSMG